MAAYIPIAEARGITPPFGKKDHDGAAEASLMALLARRKTGGVSK